jgi:hypothetical protein
VDTWFRALFRSPVAMSKRAKFISRLLGLFSEEIVRVWCDSSRSPYEDLGRPRVMAPRSSKGHTLDFTLRSRTSGRCYVAEMKCWTEYQGYRYTTLTDADQLEGAEGPAFSAFLKTGREPSRCRILVEGEPRRVHGAILIWGDVTDAGRKAVKKAERLHDVLSLREFVEDLAKWKEPAYRAFINERQRWCKHLFAGLRRAGRRS